MNAREKLAFEKLAGRYGPLDANGEIIDEGYQSTYYQRLAEVEKGVDSYWLNEPLRFATSHSHDLFFCHDFSSSLKNKPETNHIVMGFVQNEFYKWIIHRKCNKCNRK